MSKIDIKRLLRSIGNRLGEITEDMDIGRTRCRIVTTVCQEQTVNWYATRIVDH